MKHLHRYRAPHHSQPTRLEWTLFGLSLLAAGLLLGLLWAGCAAPALPGETHTEAKLGAAQTRQLSAASASVQAAGQANAANPPGAPKAAVAGELRVASANLPAPGPEDAREALARVNAALTGQLADAQKAWTAAVVRGNALDTQVEQLQKQVAAERATAAANAKKATDRLCVIAALLVGGALSVLAAVSVAAGMYFTLPKLEYGAAGLGLGGLAAFFAATQVGTEHFNLLATTVLAGGVGALAYTVWNSVASVNNVQARAQGFDAVIGAIRHLAGEVADDTEAGAKKLWQWLGVELDAAHKALIADWDRLGTLLGGKPAGATPSAAPSASPATPPVTIVKN